jgi:hypothetical protein
MWYNAGQSQAMNAKYSDIERTYGHWELPCEKGHSFLVSLVGPINTNLTLRG